MSRPPTRAAAVCSTAKPFQSAVTAPTACASLAARPRTAAPSGRAMAPCPTMTSGRSAFCSTSKNSPAPSASSFSASAPAPSFCVVVARVADVADDADRHGAAAPALADAGIQHRRLEARIGADDQDRVGALDAFDGRVEDVAGAAVFRIERCAVLAAVDVGRAERAHQQLQRIHLLDRGEIAGNGADPVGLGLGDRFADRRKGLRPARRREPAALPDIGPVEALRAQARPR